MFNTSTIDLTKAIIDVLGQFDRPVGLDEISFRIRSTQSLVDSALSKLKVANVVKMEGNAYKLNRNEQYRLKSLVA
ncbi:MAG: hypothetical protein ABI675_17945 [Chitinophagaceae bacterium]